MAICCSHSTTTVAETRREPLQERLMRTTHIVPYCHLHSQVAREQRNQRHCEYRHNYTRRFRNSRHPISIWGEVARQIVEVGDVYVIVFVKNQHDQFDGVEVDAAVEATAQVRARIKSRQELVAFRAEEAEASVSVLVRPSKVHESPDISRQSPFPAAILLNCRRLSGNGDCLDFWIAPVLRTSPIADGNSRTPVLRRFPPEPRVRPEVHQRFLLGDASR